MRWMRRATDAILDRDCVVFWTDFQALQREIAK